jgi:hypothetical protein
LPSSSQDLTLDSLQTTAQQTLLVPPTHPSINLRHHFHDDIALQIEESRFFVFMMQIFDSKKLNR